MRPQRPFAFDAIVVLPDHIHTIWTLPPGDADYSGRWRAIKARFSRTLARDGFRSPATGAANTISGSGASGSILIRDEEDFARHVDYIHYNSVSAAWLVNPFDWRWLSIQVIPPDWFGRISIATSATELFRDCAELRPS